MTEAQVIKLIRKRVKDAGSYRKAAAEMDLTAAYLCDVVNGHRRATGPRLLAALGLTRVESRKVEFTVAGQHEGIRS